MSACARPPRARRVPLLQRPRQGHRRRRRRPDLHRPPGRLPLPLRSWRPPAAAAAEVQGRSATAAVGEGSDSTTVHKKVGLDGRPQPCRLDELPTGEAEQGRHRSVLRLGRVVLSLCMTDGAYVKIKAHAGPAAASGTASRRGEGRRAASRQLWRRRPAGGGPARGLPTSLAQAAGGGRSGARPPGGSGASGRRGRAGARPPGGSGGRGRCAPPVPLLSWSSKLESWRMKLGSASCLTGTKKSPVIVTVLLP